MSAAEQIRDSAKDLVPEVGLVLGSGLSGFADQIDAAVRLPYGDLDGFPPCTNQTHPGELVLGTIDGRAVACLNGRAHLYEGVAAAQLAVPIRTLAELGCHSLIVTNAAGSLDPEAPPGRIMVIRDHINLQGANTLAGPHSPALGERFVPMNGAYDGELRQLAHRVADNVGVLLAEGVYLAVTGPSFETPAEIRAFRTLGADAVGMSTVQEVIAARQAGLRVLGLSLMTNMAAGLVETPPSADEVMETAAAAAQDIEALLSALIAAWPQRA
ncbi:MAG: purine-nucleoside phosphorylase [Pseudomonadota bacterium]